jgi:16S rRNA (cytosine1402-N4)-methyltransferase
MKHQTVLLEETVDGLNLKKADTAIDATVGLGGHAEELIKAVGERGTVLMIDADETSLIATRERLALALAHANLIYLRGNFRNLEVLAREAGIAEAHGIVFDLGWHAGQLAAGRGLSFKADEPLVMTLGSGEGTVTARDIIADWDEDDLATLFRTYGEERFAGRIARTIVERRNIKPIETSLDLASIITSAVPGFARHGRLHPATRTFQALRIAVNDELEALKEGLAAAIDLLAPAGRVAVISFHSLEDRIVKQAFRAAEDADLGARITKKPLVPSRAERVANLRARSAKLRIFEKKHA